MASGCCAGCSRSTPTPATCCRRGPSAPTAPTSPGCRRASAPAPGSRRSRADGGGLSGLVGTGVRSGAAVAGSLARTYAETLTGRTDPDRTAPFLAPRSILNGRIHTPRRFATQHYPIDRLKTLAKAADASLNDIFMAICGGALRRYLDEIGKLPASSLTANVPVSVRAHEGARVGNAVTFLFARLGTDVDDPRERLEAIRASTRLGKDRLPEVGTVAMDAYTAVLMTPFLSEALLGIGGRGRPAANLVISNVPGPSERRYLDGSPMEEIFPVSLLFNGQALNITAVSYAGEFGIGYTGCRDSIPSLQRIAVYSGEELERLERGVRRRRGAGLGRWPRRAGARGFEARCARTRPTRQALAPGDGGRPDTAPVVWALLVVVVGLAVALALTVAALLAQRRRHAAEAAEQHERILRLEADLSAALRPRPATTAAERAVRRVVKTATKVRERGCPGCWPARSTTCRRGPRPSSRRCSAWPTSTAG